MVTFTSGDDVIGRRFAADGTALAGEFTVNTTTAGVQGSPAVAITRDGQFVIGWEGPDTDGMGIFAQRYASNGTAAGGEIAVNTFTTGDQTDVTLRVDSDGNFVVAWASMDQDGDGEGVYAQRYNAAGVPQSNEFLSLIHI